VDRPPGLMDRLLVPLPLPEPDPPDVVAEFINNHEAPRITHIPLLPLTDLLRRLGATDMRHLLGIAIQLSEQLRIVFSPPLQSHITHDPTLTAPAHRGHRAAKRGAARRGARGRVPAMRVGIDLVKVADVAEALAEHGQHYLDRVYTPQEQEDCRNEPLKLAARFAAKEATAKVLEARRDDALPWPSIEVIRLTDRAPTLQLHGPAAELAEAGGITELALSFTHEDEYAAAVVVGT
jgi:holo-[acyl-carrier protein] synthase